MSLSLFLLRIIGQIYRNVSLHIIHGNGCHFFFCLFKRTLKLHASKAMIKRKYRILFRGQACGSCHQVAGSISCCRALVLCHFEVESRGSLFTIRIDSPKGQPSVGRIIDARVCYRTESTVRITVFHVSGISIGRKVLIVRKSEYADVISRLKGLFGRPGCPVKLSVR